MADTFDEEALDSTLERLALRLADGHSLDLDEEEKNAGDHTNVIRGLRALEAVALGCGFLRPDTVAEYQSPELQEWGPLRIIEPIGHGAFGDVYRAFEPQLHREVALKLVRARRNTLPVDRAVQEGRRLAKIDHPNVVTVFGADLIDGQYGIWMRLLTGRTLAAEVETRGPLPEPEAAQIVRSVARALQAVHSADIIHRDVKAQNVILTEARIPVLTDFGTGRDLQSTDPETRERAGTPVYAAPETLISGTATPQSDIYSLGVLLYFLLSARYPVSGHSLSDIAGAHVSEQRVPLEQRRPAVNRELAAIVRRATQPDPADRFQSASDVMEALEGYLASQTWRQGVIRGLRSAGGSWIDAWLRLPIQQRIVAGAIAATVTVCFGAAALFFTIDSIASGEGRMTDLKDRVVLATSQMGDAVAQGDKAGVTSLLARIARLGGSYAHSLRLACVYDNQDRLFTFVNNEAPGAPGDVPRSCAPTAPPRQTGMVGQSFHFSYRSGVSPNSVAVDTWIEQAPALANKARTAAILRYLFGGYLLLCAIPWTSWLLQRRKSGRNPGTPQQRSRALA